MLPKNQIKCFKVFGGLTFVTASGSDVFGITSVIRVMNASFTRSPELSRRKKRDQCIQPWNRPVGAETTDVIPADVWRALFADISIWVSNNSLKVANRRAQVAVQNFADWARQKKMIINTEKNKTESTFFAAGSGYAKWVSRMGRKMSTTQI